MSIFISPEACKGCRRCLVACPGDLISFSQGKALLEEPARCWGCTACMKHCPYEAIHLFLEEPSENADYLTVKSYADCAVWTLHAGESSGRDGALRTNRQITTSRSQSNAY